MSTHDEIDAQIAGLEQEIRALRMRRNTLAPINKLPDEILVHIASLLQFWAGPETSIWTERRTFYTARWTWLRGVCVRFRCALGDEGSLWATIDLDAAPRWATLCRQRAGTSEVRLMLGTRATGEPTWMGNIRHASEFLWRARTVDCHLDKDAAQEAERIKLFDQAAPALRRLHVCTHSHHGLVLTKRFLGGDCSALEMLSIDALKHIEAAPHFPNLRRLRLEINWIKDEHDMSGLLDLLAHVPLVQELILRSSLSSHADAAPASVSGLKRRSTIMLRHLQTLCIAAFIKHVILLLRVLPTNPACAFHLDIISHKDMEFWSPGRGGAQYAAVFDRMTAFWAARTGAKRLPGGTIIAHERAKHNVPIGAFNTLRFASHKFDRAQLSFRCRSRVSSKHPLLGQVTTLHLEGEETGPGVGLGEADLSGAAFLPNLRQLILSKVQTERHLAMVEVWLRRHVREHGMVNDAVIQPSLSWSTWDDDRKAGIEGFVRRLKGQCFVNNITLKQPV